MKKRQKEIYIIINNNYTIIKQYFGYSKEYLIERSAKLV